GHGAAHRGDAVLEPRVVVEVDDELPALGDVQVVRVVVHGGGGGPRRHHPADADLAPGLVVVGHGHVVGVVVVRGVVDPEHFAIGVELHLADPGPLVIKVDLHRDPSGVVFEVGAVVGVRVPARTRVRVVGDGLDTGVGRVRLGGHRRPEQ